MNPIKEIEELLSKVKQKFYTEPEQPATVETQFSEYQLADGTTVMIDKMEVGGAVMVNEAPVMDGEYQLADGTKMKVAGGVIAEIEAPAPAEPAQEDMSSKFAAIESRLQGFEQALNATKTENENLKATFAKQEELNQHFIKMFETLVKEPNTQPTEPVKNGFNRHADTKADKIEKVIALFHKK
jgi:hypothetical protein